MAISNLVWEAADIEGVWIGESRSPGPTVAVIGGVHGDEPAGIEVVKTSLETLAIDSGTVILMLGNRLAIEKQARSSSPDTNLNRCFRALTEEEQQLDRSELSYELARAQDLLPFLDQATMALDLHNYTRPCEPFIITESNGFTLARKIGASIISSGWTKTEAGSTDAYMHSQGKIGLCYEVGRKKHVQKSVQRGHGIVARFLMANEMLEGDLPPLHRSPRFVHTREALVRKGDFKFARKFNNFEQLKPGELIAVHQGKPHYAEEGDVIIFPMPEVKVDEEAYTLGYNIGVV